MACCLYDTKPLPELMMTFCQLDPWEQISVKFDNFHTSKWIQKYYLQMVTFCLDFNELEEAWVFSSK